MLVEDFWWAFLQLQFSVSDLLIEFICELGASFAQIVHAIVCQGSAKNPYLIDIFIIQLHLNSFTLTWNKKICLIVSFLKAYSSSLPFIHILHSNNPIIWDDVIVLKKLVSNTVQCCSIYSSTKNDYLECLLAKSYLTEGEETPFSPLEATEDLQHSLITKTRYSEIFLYSLF